MSNRNKIIRLLKDCITVVKLNGDDDTAQLYVTMLKDVKKQRGCTPIQHDDGTNLCGVCGNLLDTPIYNYCHQCGQKIDWSELKWYCQN